MGAKLAHRHPHNGYRAEDTGAIPWQPEGVPEVCTKGVPEVCTAGGLRTGRH